MKTSNYGIWKKNIDLLWRVTVTTDSSNTHTNSGNPQYPIQVINSDDPVQALSKTFFKDIFTFITDTHFNTFISYCNAVSSVDESDVTSIQNVNEFISAVRLKYLIYLINL